LGDELEVESRQCGTPYTMAPEIFFSRSRKTPYTIKSDIWAMGIILHEMLYQVHPFNGSKLDFKK
jgi:serine/threonine protein kinase